MKSSRYIIFIIGGVWSFGEINIPVQFANQLPEHQYTCFFILHKDLEKFLPDKYDRYLLRPDISENMDFFFSHISAHAVDLIIFSTYFMFDLERYFSLDWVHESAVPLATIVTEYMEFEQKNIVTMGRDRLPYRQKAIPEYMEIITPIPKTQYPGKRRLHYFNTYPEIRPLPTRDKNRIREEIGCPEGYSMVFFSLAKWNYLEALQHGEKHLFLLLGKIIKETVRGTNKKVFVVHVADYPMLQNTIEKDIMVKNIKSCTQHRYNELLLSSDMAISCNLNSPVAALAGFAGIPFVAFINSYPAMHQDVQTWIEGTPAVRQWYRKHQDHMRFYPFAIFPLVLMEEIIHNWKDTPVDGSFTRLEIQEMRNNSKILRDLLERQGDYPRLREQQRELVSFLNAMPDARSVTEEIISKRTRHR